MKFTALSALALASSIAAQQVDVSIGVRETEACFGLFPGVGNPGYCSSGIEFLDDGINQLTLDGTWQQFVIAVPTAVVTSFVGNGVLDGTWGIIEHLRVKNSQGITDPLALWIDEIQITETTTGSPVTTTLVNGFEGFLDGDEVLFQEPSFSGSTAGNILSGSTSGVDNTQALSGTGSYLMRWQFIDNDTTKWVRHTTFRQALGLVGADPAIPFGDNCVLTFWMKGLTCAAFASASLDAGCVMGQHSGMGPVMGFSGPQFGQFPGTGPRVGTTFTIEATNTLGVLTGLIVGLPTPPIPLVGPPPDTGIPGSQLCVIEFASFGFFGTGNTMESLSIPIPLDPSQCGGALSFQWLDLDVTATAFFPFGSSDQLNTIVGL